MSLRIDIKPGESVRIGDVAVITLEEKSGQLARLSIKADKSIPITRGSSSNAAQIAAKVGLAQSA